LRARGRCTFKQQDATRAARAAIAAGLKVQRIEIDTGGKIIVVIGDGAELPASEAAEPTALDAWRTSRGKN
jgi:hypothetical protein